MNITYNKKTLSKATSVELYAHDESKPLDSGILYVQLQKNPYTLFQFVVLMRRIVRTAIKEQQIDIALNYADLEKIAIVDQEISSPDRLFLVVKNFELANYEFDKYKQEKSKRVKHISLIGDFSASDKQVIARAQVLADAINHARNLANTPGSEVTPQTLASDAKSLAKLSRNVTTRVMSESQAKKLGMGLFEAVGRGSDEPSTFSVIEYKGGSTKDKPIVLIGKGVTFDTGGVNIKPTGAVEDMFLDMSGAATVLGAMRALVQMKVKKNVIAIIPAVENAVSGSAYRPGDILKSLSGITVEVGNTDAEGRLILADALTYAKRFKPTLVVDVATLTGAALVALGEKASAIMSDDQTLARRAADWGNEVVDRAWELPLWDEYQKDMKSDFADIKNTGVNRWGGAITAGAFLKKFVDYGTKTRWIHIDMAPRMASIAEDELAKGSTGEPTSLLVKIIEEY